MLQAEDRVQTQPYYLKTLKKSKPKTSSIRKGCFWPAVKKVVNRYELVEGTRIQTAADLHVVSGQQSHRCSVLLHKNLPLQSRAEQQEVVVCRGYREQMERVQIEGRTGKKAVRICAVWSIHFWFDFCFYDPCVQFCSFVFVPEPVLLFLLLLCAATPTSTCSLSSNHLPSSSSAPIFPSPAVWHWASIPVSPRVMMFCIF